MKTLITLLLFSFTGIGSPATQSTTFSGCGDCWPNGTGHLADDSQSPLAEYSELKVMGGIPTCGTHKTARSHTAFVADLHRPRTVPPIEPMWSPKRWPRETLVPLLA